MTDILTKEQLLDAANCRASCFKCHRKHCQERIAKTALAHLETIEKLQSQIRALEDCRDKLKNQNRRIIRRNMDLNIALEEVKGGKKE